LRLQIRAGKGSLSVKPCCYPPDQITALANSLYYEVSLAPEAADSLEIIIPFITFIEQEGRSALTGLSYDARREEIIDYWEALLKEGASIQVPDRAIEESRTLAPVVRLRDGTAVPHQPTRCRWRGRDVGWIRDALYGPVHLIDCGLIPPHSPEADWILKDHEDNIYVTPEHGLPIDLERYWFSQGGITLQANLLPGVLVYLKRDQPEHALRAFYNTFASHLYPDVRCFTEWLATRYGVGGGPFYKTPDDSAFIVWLRNLLVMEQDNHLRLCTAAPRSWLTHGEEIVVENAPSYFGQVSFRIESRAAQDKIIAEVIGPKRNPPQALELRLRHPEKLPLKQVRVKGRIYHPVDIQRELITFHEWPERMTIEAEY